MRRTESNIAERTESTLGAIEKVSVHTSREALTVAHDVREGERRKRLGVAAAKKPPRLATPIGRAHSMTLVSVVAAHVSSLSCLSPQRLCSTAMPAVLIGAHVGGGRSVACFDLGERRASSKRRVD